MLRREFLQTLAAGIATAIAKGPRAFLTEIPRESVKLPEISLVNFRRQNRFDDYGRTVTTIALRVRYDRLLSPVQIAEFLGQNKQLDIPDGFRLVSADFRVDEVGKTGTELSAVIKYREISEFWDDYLRRIGRE